MQRSKENQIFDSFEAGSDRTTKMNWGWPSRQGNNVLTDNATTAETRLKAIKRVKISIDFSTKNNQQVLCCDCPRGLIEVRKDFKMLKLSFKKYQTISYLRLIFSSCSYFESGQQNVNQCHKGCSILASSKLEKTNLKSTSASKEKSMGQISLIWPPKYPAPAAHPRPVLPRLMTVDAMLSPKMNLNFCRKTLSRTFLMRL